MAEFYQKWQKRGRRKFSKEIPYLMVRKHFQRQRKTLISFRIDPSCDWLHWHYCEIGWIFYVRARKQFPGLANTAMKDQKKETHLGEGNEEVGRIHPKSFTTSMCDRNLDNDNFKNWLILKVLQRGPMYPQHTQRIWLD